ncbi:MAG: DUF2218 domain-containing protein [Thalassobaculaceae bacterium]|nr:DUF2218 domain-containing protein [Thalassobaculaceae bacterium]
MMTATAIVRSEKAGRYLVQLCKHFAHKIPAEWTDTTGFAPFAMGNCRMTAEDGVLILVCEAETEEALGTVKYIIEDHVVRFGWKEKISVNWR